ncbi:methyl-accepting chemotaxis protein [Desulfovibrio ferrophilus]|uniref:Methyl-accepting chemotaxis sensory transducer with Cache sensor n=1 Tax=Desulfovibrio ferrophilus TaxID=241368 RepID=A0A2Z6AXU1_9BACT|nr:methyl-accepting chemotaxis protein [Desulfovibrio ferrophilus]BBD08074.1 methyl-accepting chemotaxis sensory transducer with Cache sensor [Desulfovibrio ferrophilus]
MFRRFSISVRVFSILVLLVLFVGGVVAGFYSNSMKIKDIGLENLNAEMLEGQKVKLKVASDALAHTLGKALKGLDGEERDEKARSLLEGFVFEEDGSGYFFVARKTVLVAHLKASLVGKDLGQTKDKNGLLFMGELAQKAASGGGYVEYVWPKPGAGDQPKLSYAQKIPGTDLWTGTGVYIDNIEARKLEVAGVIEDNVSRNTTVILGVVGSLLVLVVIPLSWLIVRSVVGPIREATQASQDIANGDFAVHVDESGRDEAAQLAKALNAMASTLATNIEEINAKTEEAENKAAQAEIATQEANEAKAKAETAKAEGMFQAATRLEVIVERISAASEEMSSQGEEIRQGTDVQSERIASTATAMEEMNATVLEVARNSAEAAQRGDEARQEAQDGARVVGMSIEAMNTTRDQAAELKDNMEVLGQQAESIGAIMTVIEDIADQTNLLALNAAIEAARAGEAGRGFAVVADEVRKLAEKTMGATKEVGDSIRSIQGVASQNIESMDKAVRDLEKAVQLTHESGEALQRIVAGVEDSSQQINSIATAAEEQSATSEEINRSVDEINRITSETAAGVAQSAEALRDLSEQMSELSTVVRELKEEGSV